MAQARVMFAEEERTHQGRAPDSYVSLAANHKGKPRETVGRKVWGLTPPPGGHDRPATDYD